MRADRQDLVAGFHRRPAPVSQDVAVAPARRQLGGLPDLVAQVEADDPGVVPVADGEVAEAVHPPVLGELVGPPQALLVVVGAAPHRAAGVVVQDHHQPRLRHLPHCPVEDLHGPQPHQFRVGLQVLGRDHRVLVVQLQRERQPDAVEPVGPDLLAEVAQPPELQPAHTVPAHVGARPVDAGQLHPSARPVHDLRPERRQGERDVGRVRQHLPRPEVHLVHVRRVRGYDHGRLPKALQVVPHPLFLNYQDMGANTATE